MQLFDHVLHVRIFLLIIHGIDYILRSICPPKEKQISLEIHIKEDKSHKIQLRRHKREERIPTLKLES